MVAEKPLRGFCLCCGHTAAFFVYAQACAARNTFDNYEEYKMNKKIVNIKSMAENFRYLFRELYFFRRGSVFLPFLGSGLQMLLSLVAIWIPKMILDRIQSRSPMQELLLCILGGCSVLFAVSAADAVLHNRISCNSQVLLFTVLKRKWEEKMMDLDYQRFTSREGKVRAEKARNAVSSPNYGVVAYPGSVTELLENAGGFLTMGAMVSMLHPLILVILFLLFGAELWYGSLSERRKSLLKEERAGADRKLNYLAYHMRGIREGKDIRIYSMTKWLREIGAEAVAGKDRIEETVSRQDFRKMVLNGVLICLRSACAYGYLIWQFFQGHMTIGEFNLYFSAITGLGSFLGKLVAGYSGFAEADHYITDLREFLEWGADIEEGKIQMEEGKPISFIWDQVSFSYRGTDEEGREQEIPVLKNINLTIRAGEKLAIVGSNGAGKTTFVKLMCGLLRPTEGRIQVNGVDCGDYGGEDYRKLFSAVFQKSGVLPVSIRANITLNPDSMQVSGRKETFGKEDHRKEEGMCRENGLFQKEREQGDREVWRCIRLANLEEKVRSLPEGLDTCLVKRIAEHGTELSGGEQQRLLLARALYKNAPVLILDEPTAALDPIAEHEIYQAYNQLTEGKTSVFISHRLASTRFCDRILVMEKGEIAESGTHEELMARGGRYAEMFRVQSRYYEEGQVFL